MEEEEEAREGAVSISKMAPEGEWEEEEEGPDSDTG